MLLNDFLILATKSSTLGPFPINRKPIGLFYFFNRFLLAKSCNFVLMEKVFINGVDIVGSLAKRSELFCLNISAQRFWDLVSSILDFLLYGLFLQLCVSSCIKFVHYRIVLVFFSWSRLTGLRSIKIRSGLPGHYVDVLFKQCN